VILPIIRVGNYYHNYYSGEKYYGVWFYNKYREEWGYKLFRGESDPIDIEFNYYKNKDEISFYGARQNGEYLRYANFKSIQNLEDEDQSELYFGAIRI
jgi:hypothetical protein